MADFAPNFTARYRVRYTTLGKAHSMTWRVASSVTDPTGVASKMGLFLDDLAESMWDDWTIVGADFAAADTDIFLPATPPSFSGGAQAVSGSHPTDGAIAISFVGRTTGGNKARFFLYGFAFVANVRVTELNDWKVLSSENSAGVGDAIVRLNETSPALVGNDDNTAIWYEYVNVKYNDRWVRKMRRG